MDLLKRIFGICETRPPANPECWRHENGRLVVDLSRLPELRLPGRAVRFEGRGLKDRVLLVHLRDGNWRAYLNRCTHMGRRLDYVPESGNLRCCSVSKSIFSPSGQLIDGPARGPVTELPVSVDEKRLTVTVEAKTGG